MNLKNKRSIHNKKSNDTSIGQINSNNNKPIINNFFKQENTIKDKNQKNDNHNLEEFKKENKTQNNNTPKNNNKLDKVQKNIHYQTSYSVSQVQIRNEKKNTERQRMISRQPIGINNINNNNTNDNFFLLGSNGQTVRLTQLIWPMSQNNEIIENSDDCIVKNNSKNWTATCSPCVLFFIPGLITFVLGISNKNCFLWLLGILNFFLFGFSIYLWMFNTNIIISIYSYFYSFMPVFHNFYSLCTHGNCIYNRNKPELLRRENKVFVMIYNLLCVGSGTLIYGLSRICTVSDNRCWKSYLYILFGILQNLGFIFYLLSPYIHQVDVQIAFVFYIISYIFALANSIYICFEL